ncbi:MAG: LysR family transcriptional regulator [Treponema sp.]|nr:LysR family transcriptional regulator [Treponema sp.]
MRLNFQVLTYFLAIANEESITAACEVLHVTQPTVSRQISDLEKDLGVILFERGPRKITLTKEGILFKRRAEEILSLINITEEEISQDSQELEGTVTIGGGELKSVDYVCEKMAEFQKLHPKVFFDFNTTTSDLIKDQMDKGLLDIGILLEPIEIERYDYFRLPVTENWVVLTHPDSNLAKKKFLKPSDLLNEKIILPRRTNIKNELSAWFGKDITKLNTVAIHNLISNTAVMVSKGVGTALTVETELINCFSEIKVLKLKPELTARTVVAWKKNIPMNTATTRFIEFLRE